ncbi:MAG: DUF2569 domain-containing protein [Bacteroides sp.]|nr:DUF2569 domain-containing protein [Bacteroides sp.]
MNNFQKLGEPTNMRNQNIHGWLSFFLFSISVGGIFSFIYPIVTFKFQEYEFNYLLAGGDLFSAFSLCFISLYALIAFRKKKANAVFLGKVYIILCLVSNLLALILGSYEYNVFNGLTQVVRSIIWTVIWYTYLCKSEQVKELFPVAQRKVYKRDYCMLLSLILIYASCFVLGTYSSQYFIDLHEKNAIENFQLGENDYTDGVIAFTAPQGITCEKYDTEDNTSYHELGVSDSINITIVSGYDTDNTDQAFETYWKDWQDTDMETYKMNVLANKKYKIKNGHCRFRATRYEAEVPVIWEFALLFDKHSGKVCVFSC